MSALALVVSVAVPPGGMVAAVAGPASGNDISWPQCGRDLPSGAAFGIVGVSGGRPFEDNPCLASEYQWASRSGPPGLYMNTANPGPGSQVVDWYRQGSPNAGCGPGNDRACGYDFGYAAAQHAYRFANARVPAGPGHTWWLDVETGNSWSADLGVNLAVIVGSIDYLAANGVNVGIYSTRYQWGRITGGATMASVPNWVPGARDAGQAAGFCTPGRSFSGGPVVVVQYVTQGSDYDHPCPGSDALLHPPPVSVPPNGLAAVVASVLAVLGLGPKSAGR